MADLAPYILGCSTCGLCKGARYQLPPFLYAGSPRPSVLVIAQNPGEISDDSENKWRFNLARLINEETSSDTIKTIYDVDFITSYGHSQMSKIFGEGWLTNGKFMYTNAVRCRTIKNEAPSEEMIENCTAWTSQLPFASIVVLMGKIAIRQFCSMVEKSELPLWKIAKLTKGKKIIHVLTIPHYAAMRSHADMEKARDLFEQIVSEAEVDVL